MTVSFGLKSAQPIFRKILNSVRRLPKKAIPFLPIALLVLPVIRLIRHGILIRWGGIVTQHIGHFALNTELYLCEKGKNINSPQGKCIDLLFFSSSLVSNSQLLNMWKRVIKTYPALPLEAIEWVNNIIPGGEAHNIGANINNDRDVLNLLADSKPHLSFTDEEEGRGREFLESLGITNGTRYICLNVRDSAYYQSIGVSNHRHGYRDSLIENYALAAEELVNRGFFVIRMGKVCEAPLNSSKKEIIDYAYRKIGNDFLDVYLGARCHMCLSTGSGFDAIPALFRKPVSFVNYLPVEAPLSSQNYIVYLSKGHFDAKTGKQLSLKQIVDLKLAYKVSTDTYRANGILLKENTPEEIRDVAVEMVERLQGTWRSDPVGEELQNKFRKIMPLSLRDNRERPLHGDFFIRYSENYLKNNPWWVEQ